MVEPEFSPHEERLCCVLKELVEPVVLRMVLRELKRIEADSLAETAPPAPAEAPDSPYSFGEPWEMQRYLRFGVECPEYYAVGIQISKQGGGGQYDNPAWTATGPPAGVITIMTPYPGQTLRAAEHIAACVTFCSRVPTAELERLGLDGLRRLLAEAKP